MKIVISYNIIFIRDHNIVEPDDLQDQKGQCISEIVLAITFMSFP